jgi:GGDEF domain-containing protein
MAGPTAGQPIERTRRGPGCGPVRGPDRAAATLGVRRLRPRRGGTALAGACRVNRRGRPVVTNCVRTFGNWRDGSAPATWLPQRASGEGNDTVTGGGDAGPRPPQPILGQSEAHRLVALYQLDLLDSPSSECFERVVRLAARLFELPFVSIALVDAVREWSLARFGPLPAETPLEQSIADQVVRAGDVLVIEDAAANVSLFDHPLVAGEPKVRFVAGCPVRSAAGATVGALCLLGTEARRFGPADVQVLRDLAGVVDDELAMRANRCFDEHSGLLSRRGLDIVGSHVVSQARRRGDPVSLVVVDVDVTARAPRSARTSSEPAPAADEGHVETMIEIVWQVIRSVTRSSDIPARLPCDELVVLLPDTDEPCCLHIAQRLAHGIRRAAPLPISHRFAAHLSTATIAGDDDDISLAALLRRATPFDVELAGA